MLNLHDALDKYKFLTLTNTKHTNTDFSPRIDVSFVNDKAGSLNAVIGYSSTNTNRVNIPVETTTNGLTDAVTFNANLFKEMLVANKDCKSAVLEVSNEGLAKVNFKIDDYDSTYYIVAMQDVD